jgi:Protein of unknown function (DUF3237)
MAPRLEHVFTMVGYMDRTTLDLGPIKNGPHRTITGIPSGRIEGVPGSRGEGLKVELISGGGDWIVYDPKTNVCHLDVRTQGRTKEGDSVFVFYHGVLELDKVATNFMDWNAPDPESSKPGEHYWFSSPRMETSSEFSFCH